MRVRGIHHEGRNLLRCHRLDHGGMMLNFITARDPSSALEKARIAAQYGPICRGLRHWPRNTGPETLGLDALRPRRSGGGLFAALTVPVRCGADP